MPVKKSASPKSEKVIAKVQHAAEKVAAAAGTVVGKKNVWVRQAKQKLGDAKAAFQEFSAEKKPVVKKAAEKIANKAKSVVKKVKRKAVKEAVSLAASGVARKVEKKVDKVKKKVKKAAKKI